MLSRFRTSGLAIILSLPLLAPALAHGDPSAPAVEQRRQ